MTERLPARTQAQMNSAAPTARRNGEPQVSRSEDATNGLLGGWADGRILKHDGKAAGSDPGPDEQRSSDRQEKWRTPGLQIGRRYQRAVGRMGRWADSEA